jgi:hypothetical protein
MERQKARKPLSPVKQRLKNLIAEYKDAQREHREAAQRLDGALASLSAARLRLFAVERDKNGKLTSRRIVGGKNLAIKGVIWPAEVGPDRGQASTGHGGPQTPDCGAYCDEQMESAPDDPNWTGEVWCVCDCTLSAGGGAFPGALQCFGEDEIPEETVEEA